MKAVIQRVANASVRVNGEVVGSIQEGILILLGITHYDSVEDQDWLANKIINLRIFNDDNGVMNNSVKDIEGEILLISQFTLHASTKKGNRPSYVEAAKPDVAIPMYNSFIQKLESVIEKPIKTGIFGADMKVELLNDGPVTIIIDTKDKK